MNKYIYTYVVLMFVLFSGAALAEIKYVNAEIERVEVCDSAGGIISAYLTNATGDIPTSSDGCSNDIYLPYVRIAQTHSEFDAKSAMLGIALTAFSTGKTVRIRYDDTYNNQIISLAIIE